jgi:hypothetical protein
MNKPLALQRACTNKVKAAIAVVERAGGASALPTLSHKAVRPTSSEQQEL